MIEISSEIESRKIRGFLVGFQRAEDDAAGVAAQLDELAELVANIDIIPLQPEIVRLRGVNVQYVTGSGKAAELARLAQECEAEVMVFDYRLSPSQQRNWERLAAMPVIDREEVILDIFARRASTREAVLQVELARSKYALPRLTRAWSHFSRQRGGGATNRGEGEAQLETDRRLLRRRIQQLEEELATVRRRRDTQRKARLRKPVPQGAIVGYTNVGKSSLLKALSGSELLVRDQLFATLDPSARKIRAGENTEVVLIDTVGFVRNLPHSLIEAFKSTLEEAVLADFLLLVLDASSPDVDTEWETTIGVLRELGAEEKNIQIVFNKCDLLDPVHDAFTIARLRGLFPGALWISATGGAGLDELRRRIGELATAGRHLFYAEIPPSRHDLAALVHAEGEIREEKYRDDGVIEMVFSISDRYRDKFREYLCHDRN